MIPGLRIICGDIEVNPGPECFIGHMNARSMVAQGSNTTISKFDEIKSFVLFHKFALFALTETWLDVNIDSGSIAVPGYSRIIRRDRNRHGGGICVYINDQCPALHAKQHEPVDSEVIYIELRLKNSKHLVCFCYKPPNYDTNDFVMNIDNSLTNVRGYSSLLFMGDFNCKHSSFYHGDDDTHDGALLKSFFESRLCSQMIDEPTHFFGLKNSCLDLIFTNSPTIVCDTIVHPLINNCDHAPISLSLNCKIYISLFCYYVLLDALLPL